MNLKTSLMMLSGILFLMASCVSKKEFLSLESQNAELEKSLNDCYRNTRNLEAQLGEKMQDIQDQNKRIGGLESDLNAANVRNTKLEDEIAYLKKTNQNLLDRLSDLSVISKSGAQSIQKSLESISAQSAYIERLTKTIQNKDSVNLMLVMNLKRSLDDINDEDIQVEVRGGVVYVSISDRLLFGSGSTQITSRAEEVLGKVARVLKDHQHLQIMVEGHTDSVPISNQCMQDNWDLSVKRATSVIRVLTQKHGVAPERLTAAGRSKYIPKSDNASARGRSLNRRTEIVITPKLDEYFKLMEPPAASSDD